MGIYLNSTSAYGLFQEDFYLTYYVDRTDILKVFILFVKLKKNMNNNAGTNQGKGLTELKGRIKQQ